MICGISVRTGDEHTIISKWSEYDGLAYIKVPSPHGSITINLTEEQMLVGPPTTSIYIRTFPEPKLPNVIMAISKLLPQYSFTESCVLSLIYGEMVDVRLKEQYLCSIAISNDTLIPIHIRHIDDGTCLRPMSLANPKLIDDLDSFLLRIAERTT